MGRGDFSLYTSFQRFCWGLGLQPGILGTPSPSSDRRGDAPYHPGKDASFRSGPSFHISFHSASLLHYPHHPLSHSFLFFFPFFLLTLQPRQPSVGVGWGWGDQPLEQAESAPSPSVAMERWFRKCALHWRPVAVLAALLFSLSQLWDLQGGRGRGGRRVLLGPPTEQDDVGVGS